ncbi:helix-turn-helix transcriptional regulator [Mycobacterium sp. WMMD1722]|uniref:helix-turn-helix transcriptional regulator n=1 Tax=Mycobacterium sp. WMMD1722 TaxID=3404117 RepID=UPI003BF4978F
MVVSVNCPHVPATGQPEFPDGRDAHDPVAAAILRALHTARRSHAEVLVAQALAQALAAHMLAPDRPASADTRGTRTRLPASALKLVTDYMKGHLHDQVALADLARAAHLSKYHFLRAFKATVGVTPHRYLTDLRMDRAAELLSTRRHTVSAVASMCGYASAGRFTAVFREHYGVTPGEFQRL